MKTKKTTLVLSLLLCLQYLSIGQDSPRFSENSKTYKIGGITIVGNQYSDSKALIARTGLHIGQSIEIPGSDLSKAMKALWNMQLFSDVQILKERTTDNLVFLQILVQEQARLGFLKISGLKKTQQEDLVKVLETHLVKGAVVTAHKKKIALGIIENYFIEKGFPDVSIHLQQLPSLRFPNSQNLTFVVKKGQRTKVQQVILLGNKNVKTGKLRRLMTTRQKGLHLKSSKVIPAELESDKLRIIQHYQSLGFRDAQILRDSQWREADGDWVLELQIEEGQRFYVGNIQWQGNTIYSNKELAKILGIKKGDIFNAELLQRRLQFSPDGRDIASQYLDNGHLFFQIEALENAIHDTIIDLTIRLQEGPQAIVDQVIIKGNSTTHEEVIRRELRTQPGEKFSRADIIRSQRELINLGYFDPNQLAINTPVNAEKGTVDIEYIVEEKNSDQLELAASWAGPEIGLTGTAGVSFNNFSLRNLLKLSTWNPLPSGDGQRLSLRAQSNGKDFQSYNLSFTEPWLGGKKPQALSVSFFYNIYKEDGISEDIDGERFSLFGATASLSRRLQWPDDNFISTTSFNIQRYQLNDWGNNLFVPDEGGDIQNGTFHKISLTQTIARSTLNHPVFPTSGSRISLAMEFTPPYSIFSPSHNGDQSPEEKYKWIEYHKWRFDAEWYTKVAGKLTLKAAVKMGALGQYNSQSGRSPFERFQLGGDGLSSFNNGYTGTDIISLRGYEVDELENNLRDGQVVANPLFNKFTVELRYPFLSNPSTTIYGLAFLEGGNSWQSFKDYNPFDLKRSAGLGLRAHLPMLGIIGLDYGIGFDKEGPKTLQNFGKLSLIFGFEPE